MLLLVTDTSGKQGSVVLARADERELNDVEVIEVAPLAGGMFSAQLVPQIAALLAKHGLSKTDIDAFIVVSGPGSFTGLRVGLAAIKALAEILKKPIVAVSLLEVVAIASRAQGKIAAAPGCRARRFVFRGVRDCRRVCAGSAGATAVESRVLIRSARIDAHHSGPDLGCGGAASRAFGFHGRGSERRRGSHDWDCASCRREKLSPPSSWKRTTCDARTLRCL